MSQICIIIEIENIKNVEFLIDEILNTNFNVDLVFSFMYNISIILKENKYSDKFFIVIINNLFTFNVRFITNAKNIFIIQ